MAFTNRGLKKEKKRDKEEGFNGGICMVQSSTFNGSVLAYRRPLLSESSSVISTSSSNQKKAQQLREDFKISNRSSSKISRIPISCFHSYKSLAVLSGHVGTVSCLALCGEFILSASQGKDIIVWQQPDLRQFTKFGTGDGSVKALVTVGSKVFTAHQDSKIRVWKTRRHHKKLWIEHADSISCLAVCNGYIYSGSWDKSLKLADGKIKAWGKEGEKGGTTHSTKGILRVIKMFLSTLWWFLKMGILHMGGGLMVDQLIRVFAYGKGKSMEDCLNLVSSKGHEGPVKCLGVSPGSVGGGFMLYSGSLDKSLRVWWIPAH
ncbi:hypothetical protein HAX54_003940 [Datura stramonium]|uniref:Uncharacterized protein n=1 Tax=Datura stramonium TaxID=4076 RepID=A0ABS8RX15_DATST|nr:hypothetical protein [Datura stramonium]